MNGRLSRFTSSSPAPIKGDFFLTSRFEHLHDKESFDSWITKKWLTQGMTPNEKIQIDEVEKHGSIRNLF